MDCGVTFAKYTVFIFNFLFALAGIAMIAVGAVAHNKVLSFDDFLDGNLTAPTILLIIVGCVVFLIAFLGCCGAIKENTCMLYLFAVIMLLIIAGEVAIIWTAFSHKGNVEEFIDKKLTETFEQSMDNDKFLNSWNVLQKELQCCGLKGPSDWTYRGKAIPPSCCGLNKGDNCTTSAIYQKGCKATFIEFLDSNTLLVAGIAIGVGVFELLGVVFACCLYSAYRRNHY